MAKLFPSVESDDVINQVEELEVSPEEGEVAAVQAEAEVESDGVLETAEAIACLSFGSIICNISIIG
jgi:hypothetical protein